MKEDKLETSLKLLRKYLDSPESEQYFVELKAKEDLFACRLKKVEVYLQSLSRPEFKKILQRLMDENNDDLRNYWYSKGFVPSLTNKMQILFDYLFSKKSIAERVGEWSKDFQKHETGFGDVMVKYNGFTFHMFFGQGETAHSIYEKNNNIFHY
jgi:hypothetical protein